MRRIDHGGHRSLLVGSGAVAMMATVATVAWAVTTLTDPSGKTWDIDDEGTGTPPSDCGSGHIGNGTTDAYDTFDIMCVTTSGTVFSAACATTDIYCGRLAPSTELSGRQLVLGEATLHGLTVQRRVYVPSTGPTDANSFARFLDTFHNPTTAPITVQIRFGTTTPTGTNDLGSDSSTQVVASASGDDVIDVTDEWFTTDDSYTTSGDPSLGFVMQGVGADERVDFASTNPYGVSGEDDELMWGFDDVTVPAGETIALLHFLVQDSNQTLAQSESAYLALAQLEAVEGLTGTQLTMIRNFAFCHDCDGDGYAIEDGDCNDWNDLVNPGITTDPCDGEDNDCDPSTPDGAVETWFGDACDSDDADLCEDDSYACIDAAQGCLDNVADLSDICDGLDNDCDPSTPDGSQDTRVGVPCDGDDPDLCEEGDGLCVDGTFVCTDTAETAPDVCDGVDNDCNAATLDGSGEDWWGTLCDSEDPDLCEDDAYICQDAAQFCADSPEDLSDLCDGVDNDCDPSTPDGYGDSRIGVACDGGDDDLCAEGLGTCVDGEYVCTDTMDDTPELCDGVDNDCEETTADGIEEEWYGAPCDGDDADLCEEGTYDCVAGVQVCTDTTGDIEEICDGEDNDCNPATADGIEEEWYGAPCDGADADFCAEGTYSCADGIQTCNDFTDDLSERCNGVDDDCDPSTLELVDNDGDGISACDGDCDDGDPETYPGAEEVCDGIDNDCDPMTDHDGDMDGYRDCEGDCAPMNPFIYPDAPQDCSNGLDNNCDGVIDLEGPLCSGGPATSTCSCDMVGRDADPAAGAPAALLAMLAAMTLILLRRRR